MGKLVKILLAGVLVTVPVAFTAWVLYAAGAWLDSLAVSGVRAISEPAGDWLSDIPGLGIVGILLLVFFIGLTTRFWVFAKFGQCFDRLLERVPLVKTLYSSVRDMLRFFAGDSGSMGRVVLYKLPGFDAQMLAILTNEHPAGLTDEQAANMVTIWLPMSYQLGGYMLYVPADAVKPVDMSVEQLMKLVATAEFGVKQLIPGAAPVKPLGKGPPAM